MAETYWQKYYRENRDKRIAESIEYQRSHSDERKQYMREWVKSNAEKVRQYRAGTAELRNARRRELYASDSGTRHKAKEKVKDWQIRNPDKRLAQRLKVFGVSLSEYRSMLESQSGKCAICRSGSSGDGRHKRFHLDHCHATGVVRGLLCASCNLGLGKFADDPSKLRAAYLYLRRFKPAPGDGK